MKNFIFKALFYSITLLFFGINITSQTSELSRFTDQAYAIDPIDKEVLDRINPLTVGRSGQDSGSTNNQTDLPTLGGLINQVISFIFPLAVLILFVMLFWAGFEMFSGAGDEGSLEKGKNRATMAVLGFVLLFMSYWLIQVVETIFGIILISF